MVVALPIALAGIAPCRTWRREMERKTNGSDANHCLQCSRTKVCNILKTSCNIKKTCCNILNRQLQHKKTCYNILNRLSQHSRKHVATSQIDYCNIKKTCWNILNRHLQHKKNLLQYLKLTIATSRKTCCNISNRLLQYRKTQFYTEWHKICNI
jgi:hypothetical protein